MFFVLKSYVLCFGQISLEKVAKAAIHVQDTYMYCIVVLVIFILLDSSILFCV